MGAAFDLVHGPEAGGEGGLLQDAAGAEVFETGGAEAGLGIAVPRFPHPETVARGVFENETARAARLGTLLG